MCTCWFALIRELRLVLCQAKRAVAGATRAEQGAVNLYDVDTCRFVHPGLRFLRQHCHVMGRNCYGFASLFSSGIGLCMRGAVLCFYSTFCDNACFLSLWRGEIVCEKINSECIGCEVGGYVVTGSR